MSTDISIKAKETFLTIPDVDGSLLNNNRSISVTSNFWYAQIFLAKTNKLPKIFFMASLPDLGDFNEVDNLKVQLYSVDYNQTTQKFTLKAPVGDPVVYPFDTLKNGSLVQGGENPPADALWYQVSFPTNIDLTNSEIGGTGGNKYYAYVFSSNVGDNYSVEAPKLYYSNEYRQSIFPLILASNVTDGVPDGWSNNLVETSSSGSGVKSGALLFGYVGNELGEGLSEFEAGTVTLGGGVSSRRGHATFIHVENASTQTSSQNSLAIGFSQLSNSSISNGLPEETDTSMMKWYYYQPASLPRSNEAVLFGAEDLQPVLDQTTGFVIYYQPDRLPPFPKIFSKESDIILDHSIIPTNVIYQSTDAYPSERKNAGRPILIENEIVSNMTDNFQISNFAHFQVTRIDARISATDGNDGSMNPDYIDFTLEDTEEEIKEIVEIKLSNSDSTKIRGFTNVVRFRDRYIAFAQYETESDGWFYSSAPTCRAGSPMRAYVAKVDDLSTWNSANVFLEYAVDSQANPNPTQKNDVMNWYSYDNNGDRLGLKGSPEFSRVVGVFDSTVQRAYSSVDEEYKSTLFIILQVFPSHLDESGNPTNSPNRPFFAVAWLQEQPSGDLNDSITFKIIPMENTDNNDARFDPVTDIWGSPIENSWIGPTTYPRVKTDYKSSYFIIPDSSGSLYVTARNPSPAYNNFGENNTNGKFGLWSIDLTTNLSGKTSAPLVNTSGSAFSDDTFDFRGFNRNASNEIEISYVLKDGNKTYFGTSTYDYRANAYQFNAIGDNSAGSYATVNFGYTATNSYGFANGFSKFGSSLMGEVYVTQDFVSFNQIISGSTDTTRPGQGWLLDDPNSAGGVDYLSAISFLESDYSYTFPHVVNDRVAFMTKVNSILHVWTTPSVHLPTATPFHIAHDLSTSSNTERRTRLLRKFPITEFDSDYDDISGNGTLHDGSSDAQSNLKNNHRTKYIRKIEGGIRNGHSIFIVGTDGEGEEFKRFEIDSIEETPSGYQITTTGVLDPAANGVTVGFHSDTTKIFEDFTSSPHFAWITGVNESGYNSGPFRVIEIDTNKIVLEVPVSSISGKSLGTGGTVVITKDHYEPGTAGLRWLVYDDRVINQIFNISGDSNQDPNIFSYAYSAKYTTSGSSQDAPWGYYNGVSVTEHPYILNAPEFQYYPYLPVDSNNKRKSPDIGLVHEVNTFVFNNSLSMPDVFEDKMFVKYLGLYNTGSIVNDIYNVNPRLINQNGTTYLICDNGFYSEFDEERVGKGYRVYKTYGLKQNAEKWGKLDRLDFQIFNESLHGQSDFSGLADKVYVSKSGRITFITSLKDDKVSNVSSDIGKGWVHDEEAERYIYVVNNGISLPQALSFYYKLYYLEGIPEASDYADPNSSNSELTFKWSNTREGLYTTNNSLVIPLAQDVNTDPTSIQDLSDIVFFGHSFPTDIEAGFFRIESTKIDRNTALNPTAVNNIPHTEILLKGLRMHSLDLGGADKISRQGQDVNVKEVAVSGIVNSGVQSGSSGAFSTQPEQLLDKTGGCFLSPGGYVIIDFPKPIYLSEIRFNTIYDGSISGSDALTDIEVSTIPVFESQKFGVGTASDEDWQELDDSPFTLESRPDRTNEIVFDSIRRYVRAIRVKVSRQSGLTLRLFGMKIKSLAEGSSDIFTSFGVSNANLIVVDDLVGLLRQDLVGRSRAYASFNRSDSYLIYDLGTPTDGLGGFPVNRISMNISNSDATRKIAVDVWNGTSGTLENPSWENVYDGKIVNYKHYFARWTPQSKSNSRKVNINNITDSDLDDVNITNLLKDTNFFKDFNSLSFDAGNLQNYSFRPNISRDKSLTIVGSNSATEAGIDGIDGIIVVNSQMDEDGPFGLDVERGIGLIERNLNITFPLRQVRKIRIRMTNSGRNRVYINGLKTYTPLIQPEDVYQNPENPLPSEIIRFKGDPIWPRNQVTWQVKFSATATGV